MIEPKRIQLRRQRGWRMPPNTRKVDRSTAFGNPCACQRPYGCPYHPMFVRWAWEEGDGTIDPLRCCVDVYRHYVETGLRGEPTHTGRLGFALDAMAGYPTRTELIRRLPELRGTNLACWCALCDAHKDGKPFDVACPNCTPCHVDVLGPLVNQEPDND